MGGRGGQNAQYGGPPGSECQCNEKGAFLLSPHGRGASFGEDKRGLRLTAPTDTLIGFMVIAATPLYFTSQGKNSAWVSLARGFLPQSYGLFPVTWKGSDVLVSKLPFLVLQVKKSLLLQVVDSRCV